VTGRDHGIDALRAFAIGGVVLGHWLVTGLVLGPDGTLRQASPLTAMPGLAPATWLLQTLGLFFFAGGYAATRSWERDTRSYPAWLRRHLGRLPGPVGGLIAGWAVALAGAACLGVPTQTLRTVGTLAVAPLWFLAPYVLLVVLTPAARRAVDRWGAAVVLGLVVVVGAVDAHLVPGVRVPFGVGWAVPWLLGVAVARSRSARPRDGLLMLLGGGLLLAGLIVVAGYPASAVGVPGAGRSNLAPPSLAAVALAVAQIGAFLMARPAINRRPVPSVGRPGAGSLNRAALPIYLVHQSVLVVVVAAAAWAHPASPVPGLHNAPTGPIWLAQRAAWLPVLAAGLIMALSAGRAVGRTRAHRPARTRTSHPEGWRSTRPG
jgi:hypothetical protein